MGSAEDPACWHQPLASGQQVEHPTVPDTGLWRAMHAPCKFVARGRRCRRSRQLPSIALRALRRHQAALWPVVTKLERVRHANRHYGRNREAPLCTRSGLTVRGVAEMSQAAQSPCACAVTQLKSASNGAIRLSRHLRSLPSERSTFHCRVTTYSVCHRRPPNITSFHPSITGGLPRQMAPSSSLGSLGGKPL